MPTIEIDGIATSYQTVGQGSPILMFSPGGFDGAASNWRTIPYYRRIEIVDRLSASHTCILFDKRESGSSGGRLQRLRWADYAAQGVGLLDHLGIEQAHLLGGCVGCSIAGAVAVSSRDRVLGLVLVSPAGGPHYRMKQHERFAAHLAYVSEAGLAGVISLARSHDQGFAQDPRVGPWVTVLRTDKDFARAYAEQDPERYAAMVVGTARVMFDRDTVPGVEPEDLMALDVPTLVIPGQDRSHAPSAARYLEECIPGAEHWDVPVPEQTETTAPPRILTFLAGVDRAGSAD